MLSRILGIHLVERGLNKHKMYRKHMFGWMLNLLRLCCRRPQDLLALVKSPGLPERA